MFLPGLLQTTKALAQSDGGLFQAICPMIMFQQAKLKTQEKCIV
jgi:hypothetical protein